MFFETISKFDTFQFICGTPNVQCWWPRESMLQGSSVLSEFRTSLSKVLTLCHCVKVKQRYHCLSADVTLKMSKSQSK